MRTRLCAVVGLVGLALAVVGCVSLKRTPEARFFVLRSEIEPRSAPRGEAPKAVVGVEKVLVPGHLERPQIVTWNARNELTVDEFLRWAEPLEDGITRALTEDLAALLPDHQIVRRPWSGDTRTRCRVAVVLRVFGLGRDGMVRLEGRWALLPDRGGLALVQQSMALERGPLTIAEGAPPPTGVDEMSQLVGDLSRLVAQAIEALPPEEAAVALEEETVTAEDVEG